MTKTINRLRNEIEKGDALKAHLTGLITQHRSAPVPSPRWQIAYSLAGWAEVFATEQWDGTASEAGYLILCLDAMRHRIAGEGLHMAQPVTAVELGYCRLNGLDLSALLYEEQLAEMADAECKVPK